MKIFCFWSSTRQRRQNGSLNQEEEALKEESYSWSDGA